MVNQLMQPPQNQQPMLGMQQPQGQPQPPVQQPTPDQIQRVHEGISENQKMLDSLIKLPDDRLDLRAVFDAAGQMISRYGESGGKQGISAADIVKEISLPGFPAPDANGMQPSPQVIRNFLQQYFDKAILGQAQVTAKFGPPVPKPLGTPQ